MDQEGKNFRVTMYSTANERIPATKPTMKWLTRSQKGNCFEKKRIHATHKKSKPINVIMQISGKFSLFPTTMKSQGRSIAVFFKPCAWTRYLYQHGSQVSFPKYIRTGTDESGILPNSGSRECAADILQTDRSLQP